MTQNRPVAGVGTHKDTHLAAVINITGEHLGAAQFPDTQHLPQGRHQAGNRRLNFHQTRHNLRRTSLA